MSDISQTKCADCFYCLKYSGGAFRSKAGDFIDISKKQPEKYWYYCVATKSGLRKLRHQNDWTGHQNAPSWCPTRAVE